MGNWASSQRQFRIAGKLSKERQTQLEGIGFAWNPLDAVWDQRFAELREFNHLQGHCNVPAKWPENPPLGTWVSVQRGKREKLSADRIRRLENVGFIWNAIQAAWEDQFQKLRQFKEEHGHCNVPIGWPKDRPLATWVRSRRRDMKEGVLSKEHVRRLNEIGFQWERFASK